MKNNSSRNSGLIVATAMVACCGIVAAQDATIGNPSDPGALRQELQTAYSNGARNITIQPGTYNLPTVSGDVFAINGWTNTTINAYGVTIVNNDTNNTIFTLNGCNAVTLKGAHLSQTRMTAYQGKVVNVTVDGNGDRLVDWQPSAGYPLPDPGSSTITCSDIDPGTLLYKPNVGDFWGASQQELGNNTWRVRCGARANNFAVGDWLIGRYSTHSFKVLFWQSRNCTLRDITFSRNGFATVREDGYGGGANHLLNCVWTPGPRPAGAIVDPIVSCAADGFHSTFANPGPEINGCHFEGILHDDPIAIHGDFQDVLSASGNIITVKNRPQQLFAGTPARIYNETGVSIEAKVTAITVNSNDTSTVTLDGNYNVPVPSKIVNPLACGAGYRITNNTIQGTRSRGIIAKADNGYIAGNLIENCDMAIQLGPEYYWGEADYVRGTVIENNIIRNIGYTGYNDPAILIRGEGTMANADNTIRNNRFLGCYGNNIRVEWSLGTTIWDNEFTAPFVYPPGFVKARAVALQNDNGVNLRGNWLNNPADFLAPAVSVESNVSNLTGNDSGGLGGNVLVNGDFEAEQGGYTQTMSGWSEWPGPSGNDADASFAESFAGAYSGSMHGTHWKPTDYTVGTDQFISGLANGTYQLSAWVKGSSHASGGVAQMEAALYGGAQRIVPIPQTDTWTRIEIPGIQVTNGVCKVTFFSVARAQEWIYFDHVQLVQSTASTSDFYVEAEQTSRVTGFAPLEVVQNANDGASSNRFVRVKYGLADSTSRMPASGLAEYDFAMAAAGNVGIWIRARASATDGQPISKNDSFWLDVLGDTSAPVAWTGVLNATTWKWYKVYSGTLATGNYTFRVGYRKNGTFLDKVFISTSGATPPP